ncbi:DNA repair protein RecO [Ancylothrix sp. C2]|uniref:DNA repair protein RecO n=1 Tax=Ancylothrix sp. D3o TaxID=2953691 RepID=UPI0021BB3DB9|nr:DNA repair protein RecO [Ancylothrix sp. D3o]MCT7949278.1 DNA repair protein RecO [Ancylothrix sp. D3o]
MSRTYTATGINLKSAPMGESDRLLTILTKEHGLVRAVAPGARKQNSTLSGRSGVFTINHLLLHKGRSLDKITQAETVESYPGLSRNLGKLASAQYLAEIALSFALSEHPQEALFTLLCEHLSRIEQLSGHHPDSRLLALLSHGVYHLLALDGIAPQVHSCCLSQQSLIADFENPSFLTGFSIIAGGCLSLKAIERLNSKTQKPEPTNPSQNLGIERTPTVERPIKIDSKLDSLQLAFLQQLAQPDLNAIPQPITTAEAGYIQQSWVAVERILRHYAEYHLERSIRSAALIDTYFSPLPSSPVQL